MPIMAKRKRKTPAGEWRERLRTLRARLGLTQTEAAAKLRITARSWAGYETGTTPAPYIQLLIELLEKGKI